MIFNPAGDAGKINNSGFTLVELAVVVAIVGLMITGSVSALRPAYFAAQIKGTQSKMDNVARHLAAYAQENYRLPCPANPAGTGAEPFGYSRDSGANGANQDTDCRGADAYGIVPFKTIGLTEENVRDAWGHYFTYRVNPPYARKKNHPDASSYDTIPDACFAVQWFNTNGTYHLNVPKAHFCCASQRPMPMYDYTNDLIVKDKNGQLLWPYVRGEFANFGVLSKADFTGMGAVVSTPDYQEIRYAGSAVYQTGIGYVLVSHGQNGHGAYLGDGTAATVNDATAGTGEINNADHAGNNYIYISDGYNGTQGNDYFDDIVVWRTADQIMSEFGSNGCTRP